MTLKTRVLYLELKIEEIKKEIEDINAARVKEANKVAKERHKARIIVWLSRLYDWLNEKPKVKNKEGS